MSTTTKQLILDYPKDLFFACGDLTLTTTVTWHCMRYLLPFVIYPIIVYFTKLDMHFGAGTAGGSKLTAKDKHYYDSQFQQATLVTWSKPLGFRHNYKNTAPLSRKPMIPTRWFNT